MNVSSLASTSRTEVIELRHLSGRDLSAVLDEEIVAWRERLEWDFKPSADLVEEFVDMHSLSGYALIVDNEVRGYSYFIEESRKGLIGDLYVMDAWRTWERENELLSAVMNELVSVCAVRRIESQLMMLDSPISRRMVMEHHMEVFRRTFMVREAGASNLPESPSAARLLFEPWHDERQPDAVQLIYESYRGHIDSRINDQYQSLAGARQFLVNLIQYPGCGRFFRPATHVVFRADTGSPCGLVMGSLISPQVGHITQVCLLPDSRGMGFGYEMMRRAIGEMEDAGCQRVSLTVTSANESAIRLYESMGFERTREFAAHVWDGF